MYHLGVKSPVTLDTPGWTAGTENCWLWWILPGKQASIAGGTEMPGPSGFQKFSSGVLGAGHGAAVFIFALLAFDLAVVQSFLAMSPFHLFAM